MVVTLYPDTVTLCGVHRTHTHRRTERESGHILSFPLVFELVFVYGVGPFDVETS